MENQKIEQLNEAEEAWVRDELINAQSLIALHCPNENNDIKPLEILDKTFKAAFESSLKSDENYANATINAIGIAFGQYLIDTLDFTWCAVSDEYGEDIAIVALPETAKMLVFPTNLVSKRWCAGTTNFLWYVYKGIEGDLKEFKKSWKIKNNDDGVISKVCGRIKGIKSRLGAIIHNKQLNGRPSATADFQRTTSKAMAELLEEGGSVKLWSGWTINLPQSYNERNEDGSWSAWGNDWTIDVSIIDTEGDAHGNPISAEKMLGSFGTSPLEGDGWIGGSELRKENIDSQDVLQFVAKLAAQNTLMCCWITIFREDQLDFAKSIIGDVFHENIS
ncbi:MAG: DUF3806 domain-containing protein [Planctomycetes bacterium]|nr:DUF3806 domain-containing protein [Planctomycetota bacterium]